LILFKVYKIRLEKIFGKSFEIFAKMRKKISFKKISPLDFLQLRKKQLISRFLLMIFERKKFFVIFYFFFILPEIIFFSKDLAAFLQEETLRERFKKKTVHFVIKMRNATFE